MPDSSPNSLTQKPKLNITKYGKKPLYLVLASAVILAAVLVVSVQLSTRENDDQGRQSPPVSVREEEAPILPVEAPAGLAREEKNHTP